MDFESLREKMNARLRQTAFDAAELSLSVEEFEARYFLQREREVVKCSNEAQILERKVRAVYDTRAESSASIRVELPKRPEAGYFAVIGQGPRNRGLMTTFYGQGPDGTITSLETESFDRVYIGHSNQNVGIGLSVKPDGIVWVYEHPSSQSEMGVRDDLLARAEEYSAYKLSSFSMLWSAVTDSSLNHELAKRASGIS